jgi:NADP-reducing hydrogenase subunit HndB
VAKKITSLADLNAVRDQAVADIDLRTGGKDLRITVHMGTCGIAAGARDILTALMTELTLAGAARVALQQTGCAGLCDREPMVTLTDKSGAVFRYVNLDKNKVRQIIAEHVARGNPVQEFLLKE